MLQLRATRQLRHSCRRLSFVLIQKKQKIKSQLKKKMGASASLLKLFFHSCPFFSDLRRLRSGFLRSYL
jgi:hypothetical protein